MKVMPCCQRQVLFIRRMLLGIYIAAFVVLGSRIPLVAASAENIRVMPQSAASQAVALSFEPSECPFRDYEIPSDEQVDCGYLLVPEDRSLAGSTMIRLAVAIIRTHNPDPAPDPLLFLNGGPGIGALDWVGYFVEEAAGLRAEREIILLDQRGTGYSMPDLRCVEFNELTQSRLLQNLTIEEQIAREVDAAGRCRERLLSEGVRLGAYTTAENAADINDLRLVLGYPALNLYGYSYGSRLALTVMRDFPQSVRSAVLDAALPLQAGWWDEMPERADRAFTTLFAGCARDTACAAAYPELESHFWAIIERFNAAPLVVEAPDPVTGEMRSQLITGEQLLNGGFSALYNSSLIPYLPLAIEQIYAGNVDVIAGLAGELTLEPAVAYSAMWFSVQCHDEAPFNTAERMRDGIAQHPRYSYFTLSDSTPAICAIWGVEPAATVETEPVQSDIPALVLAGEYDPIHPPAWGRLAAGTLSRSFFYELPGAGHGVGFDGCGQELVERFVSNPTVAPDAGCVEQMGPPLFITDLYLNKGIYRLAAKLLLDFDALQALPLILCLVIFGSVLVVWPMSTLISLRRRNRVTMSSLSRWVGTLAFLAALLALAFVVGLLLSIINTAMEQEYLLLFGLPSAAASLFLMPWICALLGVFLLIFVARAWQRGSGSLLGRIYYTTVTIAVLGFVWLLSSWGLLSFPLA